MYYKKLKTQLKAKTELYKHYSELSSIALDELKFERLQVEHYKKALEEIKILSQQKVNHKLIEKVIDNAVERANLDKLIHLDIITR